MNKLFCLILNIRNIPAMIASRWLTYLIRNDKWFYLAYQANIAMSFYDEFQRKCTDAEVLQLLNQKNISIHDISNQAAINFINLWIGRNH